MNDDGEVLIRVFADVHIAPGDFGGICISGTEEIRPVEILPDFEGDVDRGSVLVLQAVGGVFIGTSMGGVAPFPGGDGGVIIDFIPTESFDADETPLSITVGAGSRVGDTGTPILGPTHETIGVFLDQSPDGAASNP